MLSRMIATIKLLVVLGRRRIMVLVIGVWWILKARSIRCAYLHDIRLGVDGRDGLPLVHLVALGTLVQKGARP